MKTIFSKNQAIAVLLQIEANKEINFFEKVDVKHKYFKWSCEDLEKKLLKYLDKDGVAGVIEQPEQREKNEKTDQD